MAYGYETRVDVVPVINVSLVVVLTLMLIAPFLNPDAHDVDLPQARASEVEDSDRTEITYTLAGRIFVDDVEVEISSLEDLLAPVFEGHPHAMAVIKADRALLYGDVERLIAAIEAAGAPRIAIATRKDQEVAAR